MKKFLSLVPNGCGGNEKDDGEYKCAGKEEEYGGVGSVDEEEHGQFCRPGRACWKDKTGRGDRSKPEIAASATAIGNDALDPTETLSHFCSSMLGRFSLRNGALVKGRFALGLGPDTTSTSKRLGNVGE
jgi:hypothetical protein